jgi:hypothetical protein
MAKIIKTRMAGAEHAVHTLQGDNKGTVRPTPCKGCPWVKANDGMFPAAAFKHSAPTAYDMASHVFSCHESGTDKPAICAGFLLRGADHNMTMRLKIMRGAYRFEDTREDGRELHENYRAMSIANGVDPDDPVLAPCR